VRNAFTVVSIVAVAIALVVWTTLAAVVLASS